MKQLSSIFVFLSPSLSKNYILPPRGSSSIFPTQQLKNNFVTDSPRSQLLFRVVRSSVCTSKQKRKISVCCISQEGCACLGAENFKISEPSLSVHLPYIEHIIMSSSTGTGACFGSKNPSNDKKSDDMEKGKAEEMYGSAVKSEGPTFQFADVPVPFVGAAGVGATSKVETTPFKFGGAATKVEDATKGGVGADAGCQQRKGEDVFYNSVYDSSGDLPDERVVKKRKY
ncbi:uncharacterized protein PAC_09600 [Phialocephala subalpina]|uniref:Uncharacterized protein n=1 Tax=Phialocephala subalpina TaxID=576137 RepID=A0A1L7X3W7_9HELO|nr:uncharacterized protein PAC_09600 [Phialocephala subalpina]